MQAIELLIEFKDGKIKDANLCMATAARATDRRLFALVVDAPAEAQVMEFSFERGLETAYQVIETCTDKAGDQFLAEADVIFSGGRGMKTAKTIIAVNTDENAAIMANCDYYVVGDLFEILPELEKALARAVS